jgi:hypothetical protein
MSIVRKLGLTVISFLIPSAFVFAQELGPFQDLLNSIDGLVNSAIPVASGVALLAFFFGLAKYIFQAGDEEAQDQGKDIMIAGVVGLFLIAAIGGIIELLATAFNVDTGGGITPPSING